VKTRSYFKVVLLGIVFSFPLVLSSNETNGEYVNSLLFSEINIEDSNKRAAERVFELGKLELEIVRSQDKDSFQEYIFRPLKSLLNSLGQQTHGAPQSHFSTEALASLLSRPLKVLNKYPGLLEDLEEFKRSVPADPFKPIRLTNSGKFESSWQFLLGISLLVTSPENATAIKFKGTAISNFSQYPVLLSEALEHLKNKGSLVEWAPSVTQARSILLGNSVVRAQYQTFSNGQATVTPIFHPLLLENDIINNSLKNILKENFNSERKRAVVQDMARYFYSLKGIPNGQQEKDLVLNAFDIFDKEFLRQGNIKFVHTVFENSPITKSASLREAVINARKVGVLFYRCKDTF
jgi:hypothetical protein